MSVNKVILVGNVGKDPETRYLDETTAITKFPLATSETYKNKSGEKVSNTEWHNVVLWRGLAQVAEKYVKKGTQIYIEGRIKTRSYDDADGNRKYITEIVGDQMQMLGRRPDDGGEAGMQGGGAQPAAANQVQASATGQGQAQSPSADPGQTQAPSADPGQSQAPSADPGQTQAPSDDKGQGQTPSVDPGDPFDAGDNGPDDLPF